MNTPEFEHEGVVGFLEVTRRTGVGSLLLLSRDSVEVIGDDGHKKYPVHYDGLNYLAEQSDSMNRYTRLVTDEFKGAAEQLVAASEHEPLGTPVIVVINHQTEVTIEQPLDVAALIAEGVLPVYSTKARSTKGGELITIDIGQYVKQLVSKVGVGPIGAYILESFDEEDDRYSEALSLSEAGLNSTTFLPDKGKVVDGDDDIVIDPRSEAALLIMQLNLSRHLAESIFSYGEEHASVRLALRVASQPDMKQVALALIDLVEKRYLKVQYRRDMIVTGQEGHIFSVVDATTVEELYELSREFSLDTALHNAYIRAQSLLQN